MSATVQVTDGIKARWDVRAWRVAFLMGAVLIMLVSACTIPPIERLIGGDNSSMMAGISVALSGLVFPPILSGIARRRTLLWAYFPLVMFIALLVTGLIIAELGPWPDPDDSGSDPTKDPTVTRIVILVCCGYLLSPLISAGPVCLYRVLRRRALARKDAVAALMNEAIHTRREGVWPPPPADTEMRP